MIKSRVREFNAIRSRNLSETSSQMSSQADNLSIRIETQRNEGNELDFSKKPKAPICVNCFNHKLVQQKKQKQHQETTNELLQTQRQLQQSRLMVNTAQLIKAKQNQQAHLYNKKVAQKQLTSVQSEKQLDARYIRDLCQKQKQIQDLQEDSNKLKKGKEQKYRVQLLEQYNQEITKKQQLKQERLKTQPNANIIKNYDRSQVVQQYATDLRRQMAQERLRKQQLKVLMVEKDKKTQQDATQRFLRYTQFTTPRKGQANPQLFDQMKQLQQKHKKEQLEQRQTKQQQRKQQLLKNKRQTEIAIQQSLQRAKTYASDIKSQIFQKKRSQENMKDLERRHHEKEQKYSEHLMAESKVIKPCGECHSNFEENYLSYYQ